MRVDTLGEEVNVSRSVLLDSLKESLVSNGVEEIFEIIHVNFDGTLFLIGDLLKLDHIFEFSVNWVLLDFSHLGISEGRDEIRTFHYKIKDRLYTNRWLILTFFSIVFWEVDVLVDLEFHLVF